MRKKNPVIWLVATALANLFLSHNEAQADGVLPSSLDIPLDIPTAAEGPRRLITSTDLVTLREIGGVIGTGLSVSPDGHYLAFEAHQADVAMNSYSVAWFVAPTTPENVPVNVGDGGDATLFRNSLPTGRIVGAWVAEYAKWSPDSRGIAYRKKAGGETQVWWSSRDGSEQEQLTQNAADVDDFYWSRDGSLIYFATDADRTALQEASAFRYRNGHVFDYEKSWSTIDGRPFYPPYLLTGGEARVWVLDIGSRLERLATADELVEYERLKQPDAQLEKPPGVRQIAWTGDKSSVAWVQPDDPEKQGWNPPLTLYASHAADGSNPVRCPAPECVGILDLTRPLRDGLYWNNVKDEVLFVRMEGMGYSKRSLYGWRIGEERARKILSTDEWISDCSIVRRRALCFRETPTHPRTIIAINLADGSIKTLVDPNPEFRNLIVGDVELLEWKNAHGYGTFGYLVKPPDYVLGQRYPLVFVGYRARFALRGGVGEEYPVHLLAANGFVVLVYDKPDMYEADEIYTDPIELHKARWGPDLFDVRMSLALFEAAIRTLTDNGLVDPARVAVTGLSAGVGDVNYSLIHSDLFAAAITSSINFAPSHDFLVGVWGAMSDKIQKVMGSGRYCSPNHCLYETMSFSRNVERVSAPLLVNGSDQEHPWALEEVTALIENDNPVEMVVYPDEGHIKWQPAHRLAVYERNVDWLNFWLQGVEDLSPNKTQQYARWRNLRDKRVKREPESAIVELANWRRAPPNGQDRTIFTRATLVCLLSELLSTSHQGRAANAVSSCN